MPLKSLHTVYVPNVCVCAFAIVQPEPECVMDTSVPSSPPPSVCITRSKREDLFYIIPLCDIFHRLCVAAAAASIGKVCFLLFRDEEDLRSPITLCAHTHTHA